ncbi:MAG: hypothetical protein Q7T74_03485 [Candidatus Saccharibacteria bacterium]|nr:hypothetical protein [Candidatus Saccharibacteria bacterium]
MNQNYGYVQSTPQNSGSRFSRKTLLLVGGLVAAIIIAIILLLGSQKGNGVQVQHLLTRYDNLQTMLSDKKTTRNLKNQELSKVVTSFNLVVTTDTNDLKTALGTKLPAKIDDSVIIAESDATTEKTIEDAYLENKLDVVYADVLTKKINSLRALISETHGLSKDLKLRKTLESLDSHLRDTKKQIEDINF